MIYKNILSRTLYDNDGMHAYTEFSKSGQYIYFKSQESITALFLVCSPFIRS